MRWHEASTEENKAPKASTLVTDLSFRILCPCLVVDHSWSLRTEIEKFLPWIDSEPLAAIHNIYGAPSSNGWNRPIKPDDIIHLSRRTRLRLRIPLHRAEEAKALESKVLLIENHELRIGTSELRPLTPYPTLFARYIPDVSNDDSNFLNHALMLLNEKNINPPRMIGGLSSIVHTPDNNVATRSLMIDGLKPEESLLLQEYGIGQHHLLGFGIFLPHKSIDPVHEIND